MILEVKKNNKELAVLEFNDGKFSIGHNCDARFSKFLSASIKKGIPVSFEVYDNNEKSFAMLTKIVPGSEIKPYMLRDFLKSEGYIVNELHPEIDSEINDLLKDVPDDSPDKRFITDRLPKMSHLERTYVLDALKSA